jgi:hypothetical protein
VEKNLNSGTNNAFHGCTATGSKIYYDDDNQENIAKNFKQMFDGLKDSD